MQISENLRSRWPWLVAVLVIMLLAQSQGMSRAVEEKAFEFGMRWSAPRRPNDRLVVVNVPVELARGPRFAQLIADIEAQRPELLVMTAPEWTDEDGARLQALTGIAPDTGAGETMPDFSELATWLDPAAVIRNQRDTRWLIGLARGEETRQTARIARFELPVTPMLRDGWLPDTFAAPELLPAGWFKGLLSDPKPLAFRPRRVQDDWLMQADGVAALPHGDVYAATTLLARIDGHWLPTLPLLISAHAKDVTADSIRITPGQSIRLGEQLIPVDTEYAARPYFYREPGIQTLPADVLAADDPQLAGKIVLLQLPGGMRVDTPRGELRTMQAIAQAAASLIDGDTYRYLPYVGAWQFAIWVLVIGWLFGLMPKINSRLGIAISLGLIIIGLNAEFVLLISQSLWLPLMTPMLFLLAFHALYVLNAVRLEHKERLHRQLQETRLMLAIARREQGHLDTAFDLLRECEVGAPVRQELHALGMDMERKRRLSKALEVFRFLKQIAPDTPDADERIRQLSAAQSRRIGSRNSGPFDTTPFNDANAVKPRLGRFDIVAELGRGAMGVVYKGVDSKIGREVAIKTLALEEEFSGRVLEDVQMRFFREAEAAGRLNHPSIVTIFDVGEEDGIAYIAMDYLRGKSLADFVHVEERLPLREILAIGVSVADALSYAHEQGVIHRDIKPANIVFSGEEKNVKVTDFGVAHLTDASQTKTGTILGSPSFMSPEQVAGKRVDGRSDLWSLGVSLYQLISGKLPFTGEPLATLMYRIANEQPDPITDWVGDIPQDVVDVFERVFQKEPAARFATGDDMAEALQQCLDNLPKVRAIANDGAKDKAKDKAKSKTGNKT